MSCQKSGQGAPLENIALHPFERIQRWVMEVHRESNTYHDCHTPFKSIEDSDDYGAYPPQKVPLEQLLSRRPVKPGMLSQSICLISCPSLILMLIQTFQMILKVLSLFLTPPTMRIQLTTSDANQHHRTFTSIRGPFKNHMMSSCRASVGVSNRRPWVMVYPIEDSVQDTVEISPTL